MRRKLLLFPLSWFAFEMRCIEVNVMVNSEQQEHLG
jgi:hypothetical protein